MSIISFIIVIIYVKKKINNLFDIVVINLKSQNHIKIYIKILHETNNLILQNSVIKMLILNSNPRVAGISTKYMRKHFETTTLIKKKRTLFHSTHWKYCIKQLSQTQRF